MPESRSRKKEVYTPPVPVRPTSKRRQSPRWLPPTMLFFFVLGIAWLVAFYMAGANAPVFGTLGNWNLMIGFGSIIIGFGLATQWQ